MTPETEPGAPDSGRRTQATIATFDPETAAATAVLDDGTRIEVPGAVFVQSGLRFGRPGQRVSVAVTDGGVVTWLRIVGIGPGEQIR